MGDDLKQKSNNALQEGEIDDGISSLHDSLLHHILSYLPTPEVIRTGILSKRWKSLWTGVPRLDFEDRLFFSKKKEDHLFLYYATEFVNIVESVLLRRDGTSIQKFRLLISHCFSTRYYCVQSLIATAVSDDVQQLDIDLYIDKYGNHRFTLPCSIFDCRSLNVLKLSMKCTLKLPSRISLPRLKVLYLCDFEFPDLKSTENLFSSCPVLEELTLVKCRLIHLNGINIAIPSLKSLAMDYSSGKYDFVDDPNSCYIQVEVPAIRFFNYKGKLTSHLNLSKTLSIENFQLSLPYCVSSDYPCVQAMVAAAITHKLQELDIALSDKDQFALPCSVFDCQSLRILKLSMKCTLELPSRISLPCLKVLHLCSLAFPDAMSIEILFSSCHVLEELALSKCRWIHRNSVNISIPSLKSLTMDNSLENYDIVDNPYSCCYIKVEAPALRFFNYKGELTSHLNLSKASSIEKFQLSHSCGVSSEYSRVQSLIADAVSHKVQQIDIRIIVNVDEPLTLPCSVFDCQSLGILKIVINRTLVLPDNISLPSLKVMYLDSIAFQIAKSIEKLFSCCPALEELTLRGCRWIQPRSNITISIPSLRKLTMCEYAHVRDPNGGIIITVDAPALMYFNYTGILTNQLYLKNTSSSSTSIEACIDITKYRIYTEKVDLPLVELLRCLENMVSLTISVGTAELLSRALEDKVSDDLPVFHRLKHLDLSMKLMGSVLKGLLKLFYVMPNLSSIEFSKGVSYYTIREAGIMWMPKPLPDCFSSTLKMLSLGNVVGHSHEFFFLTSFLEKVFSLERINIFQNKYINTDELVLLRSEVKRLSERFKHCEIIVH